MKIIKNEDNFKKELTELINRHSIENDSDTPDFILASYLINCLNAYAETVKKRDKWFSFEPWTANSTIGE